MIPLSASENLRRRDLLLRALSMGGFSPELLEAFYANDPAGRAAHDRYVRLAEIPVPREPAA